MPFLVLHCNKIQLEETYKDHSIQPSDHIRANQTLKHIEGIIHMSLQQRQAQGINHLPRKGGLFQCLTTLRVIEFPKRHRFPEAEPSASLFFPSLESCREHWGHLSASSLPNWEKWPQPLLTGHPFQPCHHLWCLPLKAPSCGLNITEPRTAHNISGEAPPTLNIVREISLLSGWLSCVQWIPQNTFTPLTSRGRCWLTLSLLPSAPPGSARWAALQPPISTCTRVEHCSVPAAEFSIFLRRTSCCWWLVAQCSVPTCLL